MASAFRNIIEFFEDMGLYDVVLPFLLIFTIVFAILEKTKVFGTEDIDGKKYTKKNLNAMASFVISLFVILSNELVKKITEITSNVVLLLLLSVLFLLLVGSFHKEGEGVFLEGGWKTFFMFLMFVGIAVIFLNSMTSEGDTWLELFWDFVSEGSGGNAVGSIVLLVIIILAMFYAVKEPKRHHVEEKNIK